MVNPNKQNNSNVIDINSESSYSKRPFVITDNDVDISREFKRVIKNPTRMVSIVFSTGTKNYYSAILTVRTMTELANNGDIVIHSATINDLIYLPAIGKLIPAAGVKENSNGKAQTSMA